MAQCVVFNASGQLEASTADPCTSLVVLSPAEYGALSENPFRLSLEDGFQLSMGILACWVSAWCVRALIRALFVDDVTEERSS